MKKLIFCTALLISILSIVIAGCGVCDGTKTNLIIVSALFCVISMLAKPRNEHKRITNF